MCAWLLWPFGWILREEREGQGGDLESGQGWQERWVVRLKDQRTSKRACVYINQQMM